MLAAWHRNGEICGKSGVINMWRINNHSVNVARKWRRSGINAMAGPVNVLVPPIILARRRHQRIMKKR